MTRTTPIAAALLLLFAAPASLAADTPISAPANECNVEGQGTACESDAKCADLTFASFECMKTETAAVGKTCQIPCYRLVGSTVQREPSACASGETCVEGASSAPGSADRAWYCKPGRFQADLNLLDQCVLYHLQGRQPGFSNDQCSLAANMSRMLDQNGDQIFDIYDLDLCVLAFLERPLACPPAGETNPKDPKNVTGCDDTLVWCQTDAQCGDGLFCDTQTNACVRECGLIASRSADVASAIERPCTGQLQTCDAKGKCIKLDVDQLAQLTCEIDADCVSGAYCFLGQCAPRCYGATDCPDVSWYCAADNKCRALPPPASEDGFVFDPQNYVIRFVREGSASTRSRRATAAGWSSWTCSRSARS
ncbi:MAG: hypothetical protein R3F39_15160 [Myxococcota bacterium]